MRIAIDLSAANDPDAHRWLDRIVHRIEDGWHVWDLTGAPDVDAIESTPWIHDPGRQGQRLRDLLVASIRRNAWTPAPHGRRVRVTTHPAAPDELTPEGAFNLADEPLVIVVENRHGDGGFVERILKELDRSVRALWSCPGEPIRFAGAGGAGQMPLEAKKRARGLPYRPRLVAVIDSDRKGPGAPESPNARQLRNVCEEHDVACWVLAKREAENYLPPVLLVEKPDAGPEHPRRVAEWERLGDEQKDFFDMKHGLPDKPSPIERDLFDGLSDAQREVLATGFGPKIQDCWRVWDVRQVGEELRSRGGGDLRHGIDLIRGEA